MSPVNVVDGVRWNAAFAYLDPVRGRPGLTIAGDAMVNRLVVDGGRVTAVEVVREGRLATRRVRPRGADRRRLRLAGRARALGHR